MLLKERRQKIVEMVNEKRSVRVAELSKIFIVTEETIRRDLEKLEEEKLLIRSHGGAMSIQTKEENAEIHYLDREGTNAEEKKEIAEKAIKHVNAGDKIILDASTTAWYMAKILPDIPLTVLTNSIKVISELNIKSRISVISLGGNLLRGSVSFTGYLTENSLDYYHVNKAFISCKGLHLTRGISESNEHQARVKKKMIDIADSVYVMVDHSKFGVQDFYQFSDLSMVDYIITDSSTEESTLDEIRKRYFDLIKIEG